MIVKSFVLRSESFDAIVRQIAPDTIAVVRPEKALRKLFQELIRQMIVEKKPTADEAYAAVAAYLDKVSAQPRYQERKAEFLDYVLDYLHKAMSVSVPVADVEAYVLAQCAALCAEAVADSAQADFLDGRELVVCRLHGKVPVFDWAATREEIGRKCQGHSSLVVSGGYARLAQGTVIGIGKGGANLMASLIGSAMSASLIEFYVEGEGINGISAMTYDEAAHYCAAAKAPFPSASLWPAKNAGIPIVVKSILQPDFPGTLINAKGSETSSAKAVSGIIADQDLDLVTIYGTGLLGQVGVSSTIFSSLSQEGVNIRFISQTSSEYAISFAVRSADVETVKRVIGRIIADNPMLPLDDVMMINRRVGIVTVYGSRMKNVPGVSGKVYNAIGEAGISVIASAQGGEELSISVVLDEADMARAVEALQALA